jgi:hypothetical protein
MAPPGFETEMPPPERSVGKLELIVIVSPGRKEPGAGKLRVTFIGELTLMEPASRLKLALRPKLPLVPALIPPPKLNPRIPSTWFSEPVLFQLVWEDERMGNETAGAAAAPGPHMLCADVWKVTLLSVVAGATGTWLANTGVRMDNVVKKADALRARNRCR